MSIKLGTDGVREIFNPDNRAEGNFITPDVAFRLGVASVKALGIDRWVMVQDTRVFNPILAEAMKDGIASQGGVIADAGILPTPAGTYIAARLSRQDKPYGAISLTASHNPSEFAGIKIAGARGVKLDDPTSRLLESHANDLTQQSRGVHHFDQSAGKFNAGDLREAYIQTLLRTVDNSLGPRFLEGKKIVIDAANGAAFWSAQEVMSRLGAEVILINADPEAEINKDCGATHIEPMKEAARKHDASYGMALDGDADRLIAFSRYGSKERVLDGDDAIAIALSGLEAHGRLKVRGTVVTDYTSVGFKHEMDRRGIRVTFVKNGDRYVLEGLAETLAHVGGEKTGHTLYPHILEKNHGEPATWSVLTGDGTVTGLQQLQTEALLDRPLREISDWPVLGYSRADIPISVGVNAEKVTTSDRVEAAIKRSNQRLGKDDLILVRGSGTEPVVRVLVKTAQPQDTADYIVDEIKAAVFASL